MKTTRFASTALLPALALVVGCGTQQATVIMDDVDGINVNNAEFAIFVDATSIDDLDGDGSFDDTVTFLAVLASDDPAICDIIKADPQLINTPDLNIAFALGFRFRLNGATPLVEGESIVGDGLADFVNTGVIVRQGGVTLIEAFSDDDTGEGVLNIAKLDGTTFSGDVSSTLVIDQTDTDGDGFPDVRDINSKFEASFRNAEFCGALLQAVD